ncbi:chalcone synthase [Fibrella aestuarina BUZ 2]|uniref:Chalcone synthase n=1 Tax=Fibrella aestuarina BUZ 2 TaxID=1166018 RepID=I0KET7_9BACT|nr:type III polyketide synthase [Fibrella aestuarina]CCH02640.1 chalcone synthase [Fibrella aestuarina BUZ 2]
MYSSASFINSIGTAVPTHQIPQTQIARFMAEALGMDERDQRRLSALYRQTRIDQRHSVLPDYARSRGEYTFYPNTEGLEPFPTVGQRMKIYREEAVPLAIRAIEDCLATYLTPDGHGFDRQRITHIVTVSCTGLYAPGPDIEIIEALGLPGTTQRLAINFMGCYGAFNGIKAADAIVRSQPDAVVLVVCVELCTLHFQKKTDLDNLLSNALFADGAAAVLIESKPRADRSMRLRSFFCDLLPSGKADMAWHITDYGFEMTLTSEVPSVIQQGIGQMLSRLLETSGLTIGDIGSYAMHPGGRRILEVIEGQLGLDNADNRYAYEVLRKFGNMSSATVLFVLKAIWADMEQAAPTDKQTFNILSCAFGPGLTLESMILEATFCGETQVVDEHQKMQAVSVV